MKFTSTLFDTSLQEELLLPQKYSSRTPRSSLRRLYRRLRKEVEFVDQEKGTNLSIKKKKRESQLNTVIPNTEFLLTALVVTVVSNFTGKRRVNSSYYTS